MIKVYWINLEQFTSFCKFCEKTICYDTQEFRDWYEKNRYQLEIEKSQPISFELFCFEEQGVEAESLFPCKISNNIECICPFSFLKYVKKQRRDKILRCKNKKDKLRSLFAGLLLRFALEQEGIEYNTAEFSYGEHGKPMLSYYEYRKVANPINLYKNIIPYFFSLTHSLNYVACAISDENIGIDLEESNRKLFLPKSEKQLFSMAKRICTPTEYTYFSTLSREEQIRVYLEIWTRKESFAKADGRGLSIGFDRVEVLELEEFERKTKIAKADSECLFYDKTDNKVACVYKQVKKANCACLFYTTWITDNVCMSIYSEKTKTISSIPLTQKQENCLI